MFFYFRQGKNLNSVTSSYMNVINFLEEKLLLVKINKRDKEAFGRFYDLYAPKIYRHVFFRLGRKELAEDITGEVFKKVWEFLTEPANRIKNLKAFLYKITNNLIIDYYRSKESQPVLIDEVKQSLGDGGKEVEKLNRKFEFELVLNSLKELNQETREILFWRYVDGLNIEEIAEVTGKTKNAIYVTIHRGLKELKKIIKEYYEDR